MLGHVASFVWTHSKCKDHRVRDWSSDLVGGSVVWGLKRPPGLFGELPFVCGVGVRFDNKNCPRVRNG